MYGRINLSKVDYDLDPDISLYKPSLKEATHVYNTYCKYKNFDSVFPLYSDDILQNDFHRLYIDDKLIAWEQTKTYTNDKGGFSDQFAWDYGNPEGRVGWRFSYHVPAYYKSQGYKYLYLGDHQDYKSRIQGYEILGPIKALDIE